MLSQHRDKIRGAMEFVARIFMRLKFTPNKLTLFCLFLGLAICGLFAWNKNPLMFGILILLVGMLDVVDGTLARMTNQCTKFGSYLDAMCDRLYEGGASLAAAYVSEHWILAFFAFAASSLTSYAKARAAMEVPVSNTEWPDFIERFERSIIFTFGMIFWGCFPGNYGGHDIFYWTLIVLNVVSYASLIQRMFRAKRIIEARS
jgi:phosphatidylglycerophosphate synthase